MKKIIILLLSLGFSLHLFAQTLDTNMWVTDGVVNTICVDGDYSYIGGNFTTLGPSTGYGVKVTTTNTTIDPLMPKVNGVINCVVSDGSGGWYIGGNFTKVGNVARNYIAHIKSDKTVDATWNPNANGSVKAILIDGSSIYAAGSFTLIGGQIISGIAKLNNLNGNADAGWNANTQPANILDGFFLYNSFLYVYGGFNVIGGQSRNYLAKLNTTNGNADATWNPNPDGTISCINVDASGNIYVGGYFSTIGGQTRYRLAKLNNTTGAADASWNPNPNAGSWITAITTYGSYVYASGGFTTIGGASRNRIAKLNNTNGTADASWNPNLDGDCYTILVNSTNFYIGGSFATVGGVSKKYIAKLNTDGTLVPTWDLKPNSYVYSIALNGTDIYAGGGFYSIGVKERFRLAKINNITGIPDDTFAPWVNNYVSVIEKNNGDLYIGGAFTMIGELTRNYLAKLNTTNGNADATWNPNPNNGISSIAFDGSENVYVGGVFTSIGGQTRNYIAKLNNTNGNASTTWNPDANGLVYQLAIDESDLYVAGSFTTIGGQTRNKVAKLNVTTAALDPAWNPNADGNIYTLAISKSNQIYIGGAFTNIGGQSRNKIAKLNYSDGLADIDWNPNANNNVNKIELDGNGNVYAGGIFTNIGGLSRNCFARLDTVYGLSDTNYDLAINNSINDIAINGSDLYLGGGFTQILTYPNARFAKVNIPPAFEVHPTSQTKCEGENLQFIATSPSTFPITFQWQVNTGTGWSNLSNSANYSGVTNDTLTITGVTAAMNNYQYKCVATNSCGSSSCRPAVLTVNLLPSINTQPISTAICENGNASFSVTATGTSILYQWQVYNTGTTNWDNLSNGGFYSGVTTSSLNITNAPLSMNNLQYRCYISGYCAPSAITNTVTLGVGYAPAIQYQPESVSACVASNTTFSVTASGAGLIYQWQYNSGSGWSNVANTGIYSGATTASLTLTNIPSSVNNTQYRCEINGACAPSVTTNIVSIQTIDIPTISQHPEGVTICAGANTSFSVTASGAGITYQWQVNTGSGWNNIITSGTNPNYSGYTTNTLSVNSTVASNNNFQYRCIVSGTCTPAATSNTAILTVNQAPIINTQPSSAVVCNGNNASFFVDAAGTNLIYQWKVNTGSGWTNVSNNSVYSGASSSQLTLTAPPSTYNNYIYYCEISGTCTPSVSTDIVTLNVNTAPAISQQPADAAVCTGGNTSFVINATGSAITYQWQVNVGSGWNNITTAGSNPVYTGYTSNTLSVYSIITSNNGYQYRCIVSGSCSPAAYSNTVTLTVNEAPIVLVQPNASTVCEGQAVTFTTVVSGSNLSYQWMVDPGSGWVNVENTGAYTGATSNVLSISSAAALMNSSLYKCEITGPCSPSAITNTVSLTVNELPQIIQQPESAVICAGSNTNFVLNATGTGLTYQWKVNNGTSWANVVNNSTYSGATSNTLNITNASTSLDSYTYQCVISGTCAPSITSNVVSLEVNDVPAQSVISAEGITTFCYGDSVLLNAAEITGCTYQWYLNSTIITGATQPSLYATQNGTYTIAAINASACSTMSAGFQVTVHTTDFNLSLATVPDPPVFTSPNAAPDFNVLFQNTTPNASLYNYTIYYGDGDSSTTVTGDHYYHYNGYYTVSLIAQNIATGCADSLVLTDFIACAGGLIDPCDYTVAISPSGLVNKCIGDSVQLHATASVTISSYVWLYNNNVIPGENSAYIYVNQPGEYRAIGVNGACEVASNVAMISNYASVLPQIQSTGTLTLCSNDSVILGLNTYYGNYNWSTGQTSHTIVTHNSGSFTVTVTDIYSCSFIADTIFVEEQSMPAPQICMVLVDSSLTPQRNLVVWDKEVNGLIDFYNVYREDGSTGNYVFAGAVPYSNEGKFADIISNPDVETKRYKLTAVDTCGNETAMSDYHQTIHISISNFGGYNHIDITDHYFGFLFDQYFIYRYHPSTGWVKVHEMPSINNGWTDVATPDTSHRYYVSAVKLGTPCHPNGSKDMSGPFSQSLSNIEDNGVIDPIHTKLLNADNTGIFLFPNPVKNELQIILSAYVSMQENVEFINLLGEQISVKPTSKSTVFDVSELTAGIYFVKVKVNNTVHFMRFVKQ